MATSQLVVVGTYNNHIDADLARSVLEAAEIDALIRADDAGGEQPGLWLGQGVKLLVRAEDAERATEVLTTKPESSEKPEKSG